MVRTVLVFLISLGLAMISIVTKADEPVAKSDKPIRALLITGGCCHDYDRQKLILAKGISARANVHWTVVQQGGKSTNAKIPIYDDPNWADGFDVVVHNECFAAVRDVEWVEQILKPHRAGVGAVLIHCAMHCYRTGDDRWFEFVGMQSPAHGPHYSYTVDNVKEEHPIMAGFGDRFVAPKGELYHSIKLWPTATALGQAKRRSDEEPQTCIWTNEYKKGRVFATTIGHYNETMAEPKYLDMVTRGLLWTVDRLDESAIAKTDEKTDDAIRALVNVKIDGKAPAPLQPTAGGKCCGDGNLALGGPTEASSEELAKNNFARHAIDGDLGTRWCSANGSPGATWQVDLGKADHIKSLRIHWEKPGTAYQYKVDASADGEEWKTILDESKNKKVARITPHQVDSPDTRFLRVTFLGSSTRMWGSFWEFEAYASEKLPELPKGITASPQQGSAAGIADVRAPAGFNVTLFGAPPQVNYPVCLTAAPTGEVFVGVDKTGSLGKEKGMGYVLRCLDTDGDGQADQINEFAKMDHPRGLVYDNGSLWVLHPPKLSVYHDDDRDGRADRHEVLVTGISTDYVQKRGADHTTNGIRMGIDGWIYIAVGDFGFIEAKGTDGTTLSRRGGGIVRVRPDGTEMEIYCWGLRNILDVSIDPYMNIFTRDNTNDGGGWDIRVSHILQTANYGYPSLYKNFTEEIMPPLANYGGGSGCGTMFFHDERWPSEFGNALYTADWGRSEVYRHNLPPHGATFDPHQETFVKIPRPTDIDVDGSGRMYISSWKNGKFAFQGENVGFVAQITPQDFLPKPFPDLAMASNEQLVKYLESPSAVYRLHAQREILRRANRLIAGPNGPRVNESGKREIRLLLNDVARGARVPLYGRVAAIFTLKQLLGTAATSGLVDLSLANSNREFALRALTDRKSQLKDIPVGIFVSALKDEDPRVRAQAVISLGRLGKVEAAEHIIPLTMRDKDSKPPTAAPTWNQPDPGRVIPHLAVRALADLNAVDACLKALNGPHARGALAALKLMHDEQAVSGLAFRLSTTHDKTLRREILTTLIRLYHREADYKQGWWGTRPDTTGPYFDRATWSQSPRIAKVIKTALGQSDKETADHIVQQLARHVVKIDGLPDPTKLTTAEPEKPIELPPVDPNNPNLIANIKPIEKAASLILAAKGNAERGQKFFTSQSCIACHTYENGQTPKGPHLVDIGKRYKPHELVESILKPSEKIAQGFDTYSFIMTDGRILQGFVVTESATTVRIRDAKGLSRDLKLADIEERLKQKQSMMPVGIVNNLTSEQVADLVACLQSLK